MSGTPTPSPRRSVQLAVLATPTASIVQAVTEARHRQDAGGRGTTSVDRGRRHLVPAGA